MGREPLGDLGCQAVKRPVIDRKIAQIGKTFVGAGRVTDVSVSSVKATWPLPLLTSTTLTDAVILPRKRSPDSVRVTEKLQFDVDDARHAQPGRNIRNGLGRRVGVFLLKPHDRRRAYRKSRRQKFLGLVGGLIGEHFGLDHLGQIQMDVRPVDADAAFFSPNHDGHGLPGKIGVLCWLDRRYRTQSLDEQCTAGQGGQRQHRRESPRPAPIEPPTDAPGPRLPSRSNGPRNSHRFS